MKNKEGICLTYSREVSLALKKVSKLGKPKSWMAWIQVWMEREQPDIMCSGNLHLGKDPSSKKKAHKRDDGQEGINAQ